MTSPRSPLAKLLPVMRADESPRDWERSDRVRAGRFVRDEHDALLLWRDDLSPLQVAALDAIAAQVLGPERNGR